MSGLLNKLVADGSVQLVATLPEVPFSSVNILVLNPTGADAPAVVWATFGSAPTEVDMLEPGAVIPSKGRCEITGRIMSALEKIFVQAAAGLVVRVEYVEEV